MKIVLTGAAGAPGRHLLDELLRHDSDVAVLDASDIEQPEAELGVERREAPSQDVRALSAAISDADFVVHAHVVEEHGLSTERYAAANVEYATSLLDACLIAKPAGVLYVTSTGAYGPDLPPWPVTESWTARPRGAMQASLATAEQAARTYRRRVPLMVLRSAPWLSRHGGALRRIARHFAAHPKAGLVGGGRAPLSLTAGADLGRAAWQLIERFAELEDRTYHATSVHTTWRQLAEEACRVRGVEPRFWSAPAAAARALDLVGAADWLLPAPEGLEGYVPLTAGPHLIDDGRARAMAGYAPVLGLRAALIQALGRGDGARGDGEDRDGGREAA